VSAAGLRLAERAGQRHDCRHADSQPLVVALCQRLAVDGRQRQPLGERVRHAQQQRDGQHQRLLVGDADGQRLFLGERLRLAQRLCFERTLCQRLGLDHRQR